MKNKKIMIIGGTGALGNTLVKTYSNESSILVFSRDEHKHVLMERKFPNISFQIGDVKDKSSILKAINEYKPDIIINTAALKHVPICEVNPFESVQVNILGHQNLIECVSLSNHRIESLIFISTDKACKPINVYGMSKAISERLYVDFANKQTDIKVVLCRYGNVMESTGSVIPLFKGLLEAGKTTLPVTDLRMTRFLISLKDSVELINWAYNHPKSHGSIVVPKLKSIKITDLVKELSSMYKIEDLKIDNIGIRPGEKIHEEMVSREESLRAVPYEKYYMITDEIVNSDPMSLDSSTSLLSRAEVGCFLSDNGVTA